jgi:hypothetical protein
VHHILWALEDLYADYAGQFCTDSIAAAIDFDTSDADNTWDEFLDAAAL